MKKGEKHNRLTAIRFSHKNKYYQKYWLFKCDCGKEKVIRLYSVIAGDTKSCGCLWSETNIKNKIKHGMYGQPIYQVWQGMKQRCINKNNKNYKNYGGRGITVCKEWIDSFNNFYKDMGNKPERKSIDRIDNNKGYCKENCRWATVKEQSNNRRTNHLICLNDKIQNITQWSKELNVSREIIHTMIKNNKFQSM